MVEVDKTPAEAPKQDTNPAATGEQKSAGSVANENKGRTDNAPARDKQSGKAAKAAPAKKKSAVKGGKPKARKAKAARKAAGKKAAPARRKSVAQKAAAKKAPKKKASSRKAAAPAKSAKTEPKAGKSVSGSQNFKTMEKVMTKNKNQFDQLTKGAASAGRESMEAIVESGNVFARGFEDLVRTYVSWAQDSAEKNSQAFKDLLSCKTLNELTETQSRVARENFDDFMSGVTKISELSVKLTTEAFEPINDQVSKTIKRAGESAAA